MDLKNATLSELEEYSEEKNASIVINDGAVSGIFKKRD